MELEQILPEITRPKDAQQVLTACRRFANVLTDRRWDSSDMRRTKINREFLHSVTVPALEDPQRLAQTERLVSVEVKFAADKTVMGYDTDTKRPEFDEFFTVSANLREDVDADELPDWILSQLLKGVRLLDPDNEDDEATAVTLETVTPEMLGNFKFEKLMEVEYVFDEDTEIADHSITCAYFCDGGIIDRVKYGWSDEMIEAIPTIAGDNLLVGEDSEFDRPLGEADIQAFRDSLDTIIDTIYDFDAFEALEQDESEEGMYVTEDTHCRRAMAMIALNSRRFIGMRIR